jgi:sporulation protein YlmC with PRC-barrel domain
VAALTLKKTSGQGDTLPWSDIAAFGEDAVIVAAEDVIVTASGELQELADKRHHADGKRVLNTEGVDLGPVRDVEFDIATGRILTLDLKEATVEAPNILGIGSYAVIIES